MRAVSGFKTILSPSTYHVMVVTRRVSVRDNEKTSLLIVHSHSYMSNTVLRQRRGRPPQRLTSSAEGFNVDAIIESAYP